MKHHEFHSHSGDDNLEPGACAVSLERLQRELMVLDASPLDPMAYEHVQLALDALNQARAHMALAGLHHSRALAEMRG